MGGDSLREVRELLRAVMRALPRESGTHSLECQQSVDRVLATWAPGKLGMNKWTIWESVTWLHLDLADMNRKSMISGCCFTLFPFLNHVPFYLFLRYCPRLDRPPFATVCESPTFSTTVSLVAG